MLLGFLFFLLPLSAGAAPIQFPEGIYRYRDQVRQEGCHSYYLADEGLVQVLEGLGFFCERGGEAYECHKWDWNGEFSVKRELELREKYSKASFTFGPLHRAPFLEGSGPGWKRWKIFAGVDSPHGHYESYSYFETAKGAVFSGFGESEMQLVSPLKLVMKDSVNRKLGKFGTETCFFSVEFEK